MTAKATATGLGITDPQIPSNRQARVAGLLYLLAGTPGPFGYLQAPGRVRVRGDPLATLQHIVANPGLLRAGVLAELLSAVLLICAAAALRRLFAHVDRWNADLMLLLAALPAAIIFENAATQLAALNIAQGGLGPSATSSSPSVTLMLTEIHRQGIGLANIFWGLWLIPLGLLVARSTFVPQQLGWLLLAGGTSYVVASTIAIGWPKLVPIANPISWTLGGLAEFAIILWLIIRGTGTTRSPESRQPIERRRRKLK